MPQGNPAGFPASAGEGESVLTVRALQGPPSNSNVVIHGTTPDLTGRVSGRRIALPQVAEPPGGTPLSDRSASLAVWGLEAAGCSVLLLDVEATGLRVIQIGPGFERLTGYNQSDLLGCDYDFFQGPATDPRAIDHLHRAIRGRVSGRWVIRSYRKSGAPFWNEVTVSPVFDASRGVTSVRVLQCDVSDRVEARGRLDFLSTQLSDRQQFTSAVLEGIHAAIITADSRGRVTFINRVACTTLGVSPAQVTDIGLIPLLNLPPDVFDTMTESDRVKRLSYPFKRDDGQSIEIGLSMSRAFGDAHHDLGYFVVFRDLSDSMQFELDVRRVERLAAMGTMVAGFAHEIRNPVTTLRLLTEVMRADAPREDPCHEYLSRMMLQIERIERLVKTSLQFGRPVAPRRSPRPVGGIVTAALEALAGRLKGAGSSIRSEVDATADTVFADDTQIAQILVILLENAVDAAGGPERVTLRARAVEGAVQLEVHDQGPGIPQWLMNRIFDPFFTTKPNGTGLGLSIAQQLVHENRGRIEVSSVEGKGTTFTVIVPTADPGEAGAYAGRPRERISDPGPCTGRQRERP